MAARLNVYFHPSSLEHKGFPGFAERPARLRKLAPIFNKLGLPVITPPAVNDALLKRVHDSGYVDHVKGISEKGLLEASADRLGWRLVKRRQRRQERKILEDRTARAGNMRKAEAFDLAVGVGVSARIVVE